MKRIFETIDKNKKIWIMFVIWMIILILLWIVIKQLFIQDKENEIWISLSEFSSTLEMEKEWKLLSYPEIDILSEVEWEIVSLNVEIWDIVDERTPLIQIDNGEKWDIDIEAQISRMFSNYYDIRDRYEEFNINHGQEIKNLEKEIIEKSTALWIAIDMDDKQWIKELEKEIWEINEKLTTLQSESNSLESQLYDLDEKIQVANAESIKYYYEMEKKSPSSTIPWIVWNIHVQIWDEVLPWDKLFTIINNSQTPEIAINMDFQEYLMTKDLTLVDILIENENWWDFYYEWEIYTRSPILNEEWKYTITVRFLDEVFDLILSDKNTKITVIFSVKSDSVWIPQNCFTEIWNNTWTLTLHDGETISSKEIWIKNKWKNWINVDQITTSSLENEEKKDEIQMCIASWSNIYTLHENETGSEILCKTE